MGVDRGQGEPAVVLGLEWPAVVLLLKPQDAGPQHTAAGQVVARPGLHGPQVLTDDHSAGPVSLQQDDAEHGLVVVAHVGAVVRTHALGDPPQAEQADDVVHAQCAGVTQDRAHHVTQRGVGAARQVLGVPRRLGPVLALLVVHVRRSPHGDSGGEGLRVGPHVSSLRVDSHREVIHDAQGHPRSQSLGLGTGQLLVDDPLQPGEEVDALGQLVRLVGDVSGVRLPQRGGPVLQGPVLLHQRAPQGEALQPLALLGPEALEVSLAGVGATGGEDDLEGLALGLPHRVAVDRLGAEVTVLDLFEGPLHQRALGAGQAGHLGDVLRPDVEGVDEATCHRQVGRVGHRRHRLSRVQRVDEQEVGSLVPQEGGELSEIVGVTGPPRPARAGRVQLGHDPPAPVSEGLGKIEVVGGDRQRRGHGDGLRLAVGGRRGMSPLRGGLVRGAGADLGDDPVPSQGQIGSEDEGGAAALDAVHLTGHGPVLSLSQLTDVPVLELDAHPHLGAVGHVDGDGRLHTAARDDRGGKRLPPGGVLDLSQSAPDLLLGVDAHP